MHAIELTDKEVTYLLLALKRYEAQLLAAEDEDLEDATTDLLFVQSLRAKLAAARGPAA